MKWLVAPNAFKGTLSAEEAADIIEAAILENRPGDQVDKCPIADGGDGTCLLLSRQLGLEIVSATACGPLGRPVSGFFGYHAPTHTAFLDVSTVSGIKWLATQEKEPWTAGTYGTGELIQKAIDRGAKEIILGLGGSASIDMGTGILQALGVKFLDKNGRKLPQFSPGFLERVCHIQIGKKLPEIAFTCLCDVSNPFFGPSGAIPVFGPQKGLDTAEHQKFSDAAGNLFALLKKKSKWTLEDQPCFGAAGGIALGLSAFFPTKMVQGARYFFEKTGLKQRMLDGDMVITGEGKFDFQSAQGKGSFELMQLARSVGKPIWLISAGKEGAQAGFDKLLQLAGLDFRLPDPVEKARQNLRLAVSKGVKEMQA
ncbi:glycerate kinase [Cyclobacterium lianum]|uniref:Glycerate kinase n=1 Tax=Cyclobacterium lianum TaxID=388280 RepID=A0A1M7P9V1_9BACT|nr:glycerate kinase [Cyclobacterium lianum]SHN13231.1 glycerate kinase [Cyclobacterium lianum]